MHIKTIRPDFKRTSAILALAGIVLATAGCRSFYTSTDANAVSPGLIEPILEPDAGAVPLVSAIKDARSSISLAVYLLTEKDVIEELKSAKQRGVEVRVILEQEPSEGGIGNQMAKRELANANIGVTLRNSDIGKTHSKYMVTDGMAIIMTFDLTRPALTDERGFAVTTRDPLDVSEIKNLFDLDWTGGLYEAGDTELAVGPATSRTRLLGLIDGAKESLEIEAADMQDEEIEEHLMDAARRGVLTRVLMSPPISGPDTNAAGRDRIVTGQVSVRLTRMPPIGSTMIVVDGKRAFIGSQRFNPSSLDSNRELGIFLTDKRTVEGLHETFVADWSQAK